MQHHAPSTDRDPNGGSPSPQTQRGATTASSRPHNADEKSSSSRGATTASSRPHNADRGESSSHGATLAFPRSHNADGGLLSFHNATRASFREHNADEGSLSSHGATTASSSPHNADSGLPSPRGIDMNPLRPDHIDKEAQQNIRRSGSHNQTRTCGRSAGSSPFTGSSILQSTSASGPFINQGQRPTMQQQHHGGQQGARPQAHNAHMFHPYPRNNRRRSGLVTGCSNCSRRHAGACRACPYCRVIHECRYNWLQCERCGWRHDTQTDCNGVPFERTRRPPLTPTLPRSGSYRSQQQPILAYPHQERRQSAAGISRNEQQRDSSTSSSPVSLSPTRPPLEAVDLSTGPKGGALGKLLGVAQERAVEPVAAERSTEQVSAPFADIWTIDLGIRRGDASFDKVMQTLRDLDAGRLKGIMAQFECLGGIRRLNELIGQIVSTKMDKLAAEFNVTSRSRASAAPAPAPEGNERA